MLRGRRLPLPQSPLSRWRTTAPAPGLHRATATASLFTTTIRLNDKEHDERLAPVSEGQHGEAGKGAKTRLRIHKIGVYGDDWALLHGKWDAKPMAEHTRLSLQGKKPFGDRDPEDRQRIAEMSTRLLRRKPAKRRDAPKEVKGKENYYSRKLLLHRDEPSELQQEKDPSLRRIWYQSDAPRNAPQKHYPPQRVPEYHDRHHKSPQGAASTNKHMLREELSQESSKSTEGKANITTEELQNITVHVKGRQASDGLGPTADQPQEAMPPRAGFDSLTEMSPSTIEAIKRQRELIASEKQALFRPRPMGAPDVPALEVPYQVKPLDAVLDAEHHLGEVSVATAGIGPAESLQNLFAEDPVLMKARSLARMPVSSSFSLQTPSRLEVHTEPRFRLVFSRKTTPGKLPKSMGPFKLESKSLPDNTNQLQTEIGTKPQREQDQESVINISSSRSGKAETTGLEGPKMTDDTEIKAVQIELQAAEAEIFGAETGIQQAPAPEKERLGLVGPVQSTDNRSIFERLFAEPERIKGTGYGQPTSKLRTAFSAAERGEASSESQQKTSDTAPRHDTTLGSGLSIFGQLFPEQVESGAVNNQQDEPRATHKMLHPPEDSFLVSLRNEVRNWISKEGQDRVIGPQPGDYGSHSTVVVISGTSPSLIDTDFYRIAPEGQHVEGWAGGLVKVIQAHDSISWEPLGRYYLMFYSRPSALAYVDEVRRLHALSRQLLHAPADSGREVAKGSLDQSPISPQPFLTDEERAAVRSFTLYSPNIKPNISVRMWNTELVKELAAKSNIADILPTLRPEGSTPARVLLKLSSPDGQHGEGQGGLTTDELWLTLRDDGRERSAPWVLANLTEGIMPVKPRFISEHYKIKVKAEPVSVPLELDEDDVKDEHGGSPVAGPLPDSSEKDGKTNEPAGAVDRNERFNRFVLTFTQPAIARRFVRCWHKRAVYDAVLERSVVVDAVAIM
ncbi:hypothetical protein J7T55_014408 [Diaporthe amygdali]|uniref:uncharacterized protein n=1 Tax=Phomopsis amygdali TaxID=1214568 RepID=UPI0022FE3BC3|nr:uncharacterized protein J7T55_014408 [Diaporthe amygdali]KAJ0117958.1 hypothetical protein J7T55_014408 [Diaporthe amygdali]